MKTSELRSNTLAKIEQENYDILIIGGGATGLGCALDAQLRGYKTLLVESNDFCAGASSASTKLIHGGVRYLEKAVLQLSKSQYVLVREALSERGLLLKNASALVSMLPIIIPVYKWWEAVYYFAGTKFYDWIAGLEKYQSKWLDKEQVLEKLPGLRPQGLKGGLLYFDGQFDDAGLGMALVRASLENGGDLLNYMSFQARIDQQSCQLIDNLTHKQYLIKTKCILNCTGPNADLIRQQLNPELEPVMAPSSGVHICFPGKIFPINAGFLIPKTADGRVIFVLPWQNYVLFGTTDSPVKDTNSTPKPSISDINYLLQNLSKYFEIPDAKNKISGAFEGYRPLIKSAAKVNSQAIVRSHQIEIHSEDKCIHVLGGKWTIWRKMAEDALDAVEKIIPAPKTGCKTQYFNLNAYWLNYSADYTPDSGLLKKYLPAIHKIYPQTKIQKISDLPNQKLHPNATYTFSELIFMLEYSYIQQLSDLLTRRFRIAILDIQLTKALIPISAECLQILLNWGEVEKESQIKKFEQHLLTL